jgi:Protein of unknown function (DUF3592)
MTIGTIIDRATYKQLESWKHPSWWKFLIVTPWIFGLIFLAPAWKIDREIATRQQTTNGTITAHEPSNHDRYEYIFSVNGHAFIGWQSPRANELQIGKEVLVYYDPVDPNQNSLRDFNDVGDQDFGPIPLLIAGILGAALIIFLLRRSKLKTSSADPPGR